MNNLCNIIPNPNFIRTSKHVCKNIKMILTVSAGFSFWRCHSRHFAGFESWLCWSWNQNCPGSWMSDQRRVDVWPEALLLRRSAGWLSGRLSSVSLPPKKMSRFSPTSKLHTNPNLRPIFLLHSISWITIAWMFSTNGTVHIGHLCRKTSVWCCHGCLTAFEYRWEFLSSDVWVRKKIGIPTTVYIFQSVLFHWN